jgi:hypothetical protein
MGMAIPPLVGDLPTEVFTGMAEGNAGLDDDVVIDERRWFMIKTPL